MKDCMCDACLHGGAESGARLATSAGEWDDARPKGVLVIDDEPLLLRVLTRTLRTVFDVTADATAEAALQRIESGERFAAILCDVNLGGRMSGVDFAMRLAEEHRCQFHRLVFIAGHPLEGADEKLRDRPVLLKPFDLAVARGVVERLARHSGDAARGARLHHRARLFDEPRARGAAGRRT